MRDKYLAVLAEYKEALLDGSLRLSEFGVGWRHVIAQLPEDDAAELGAAIHEAGHAVMCWLVECPFEYVTIIQKEGSLGHVMGKPFPEHLAQDMRGSDACRATEMFMDRQVIISLAGYAAESLYLEPEKPNSRQSKADRNEAYKMMSSRGGRIEDEEEYLNDMQEAAIDSLRRFLFPVHVLSIELLEKRHVEYSEVIALLESVPLDV